MNVANNIKITIIVFFDNMLFFIELYIYTLHYLYRKCDLSIDTSNQNSINEYSSSKLLWRLFFNRIQCRLEFTN